MSLQAKNSIQEPTPRHRSRAFFSAHPVFRREEYAQAVGRASTDQVVSAMLTGHLNSGNIRRVARGVFVAVPPHAAAASWVADKFLVTAKLKPDAVIAYHSALELHGAAYTDSPDVLATTTQASASFVTLEARCRFVGRPKGFNLKRDTTLLDRAGLSVRVTTLERTIVDLFDRVDLAGGAEELFNSLPLVQRLKVDVMVRQLEALQNAGAAAALGWWLERDGERLGVPAKTLDALQSLRPKHPQYVLGAQPGSAKSIGAWNILVPRFLVTPGFEGM